MNINLIVFIFVCIWLEFFLNLKFRLNVEYLRFLWGFFKLGFSKIFLNFVYMSINVFLLFLCKIVVR